MNDHIAYFITVWPVEPVYHAFGESNVDFGTVYADVSKCGRDLYAVDKLSGRMHTRPEACLPRHHADKFARPCKVCYPEEYSYYE